ncbi:polysaccharide lyase family 7 protein [Allokutzneria sp. A3M-2-11 16]|uniref:polysaccharide lyase family 7 protein n=1 Tax=Allokutzneria sp. A3M-2-11 16 TaxID=2962043 RepID=UPI0020B65BB2|nr:polysaccharide lyase family 7 protein [Allokutzneria sp. A3M-2-11 16]MCP3805590.1 polysaccharide lyase family 7 protein [Allokutzneria sp. A3M-2-11 16]
MRRVAPLVLCLAVVAAAAPAVSAGQAVACGAPGKVLNLKNWKLQLPIGEPEKPTEISQPALDTYTKDPWFKTTPACDGVQFRAAVNGVSTGGSQYPRSELREMDGSEKAAWSTSDGTHTMVVDQAITAVPAQKPQVIAGQVHNTSSHLIMFRLDGTNLYIHYADNSRYKLVTSDYRLGQRFQVKFVASGGKISAYYNDILQTTVSKQTTTAYFKAGAYTLAHCDNSSPCNTSNYGQVVIYKLSVSHS